VPLSDEDRFRIEYAEVGSYIRHYSTVRSGLTSFLVTVGLAAFSTHFSLEKAEWFPFAAGCLLIASATVACLSFSYRTERCDLYLTELWRWSLEPEGAPYPVGFKSFKPGRDVLRKMAGDQMNWLMIVGAFLILAFAAFTA
jgi:hypothetical protein